MPQISNLGHELGTLQAPSMYGNDARFDHDNGKKPLSSANLLVNFDQLPISKFVTFRDLSCTYLAHHK